MAPTCKSCRTPFNQREQIPHVLTCGHTVCKACLVKIEGDYDEIKCPTCRMVDSRRIDELPVNHDLLEPAEEPPPTRPPTVNRLYPQLQPQHETRIRIIVRSLQDKSYPLMVSSSAQVSQIKTQMLDQYGFDMNQFSLLFGGRLLQDDNTIANSGIVEGDTLQLSTKFVGGEPR